ncbi:MAG TPA: 4-hydroxythreonine-4-phosphate dehydrogenase PdxA [Candidatus Binatia bacterium]|nr:4-hydroxythreonine-4-phosphate dehydrogenase PdxA [Candidatus Binatia bacterium]
MRTMLPLIGVTMGDPAGIGPEVVLKAATTATRSCRLVVLGDMATLSETACQLGSPLTPVPWQPGTAYPSAADVLPVLPLSQLPAASRQPGRPTTIGGEASYQYVETGTRLALAHKLQGLVTAPISKAMWHAAGRGYPGHTELLAALTHTPEVRMMLVGRQLRVILVTTHLALAQVPAALSGERIRKTIVLAAAHLSRFHGVERPRLAVAGLNPHAGEAGAFGDEEERIIAPAVQQAQSQGLLVAGPFPADSVFVRAVKGEFDGVVCLYHDQGLIPFKLLSWEEGVNVTIGLPIVRTSPDHGTAFDIAGQGRADPRSLGAAIALAAAMTRNRSTRESSHFS